MGGSFSKIISSCFDEFFVPQYSVDIKGAKFKIGQSVRIKQTRSIGKVLAVNHTGKEGFEYYTTANKFLLWENEIEAAEPY